MSGFQKNVASQKWMVFAFNETTNVPLAGDAAQISAKIRKDYGSATATNDVAPTELEDGYYEFDLLQAETNAEVLDLLPESSTADIQVIGVPARVFTVPPNFSLLGVAADGDLTKVNTLDGHTAQTGDNKAVVDAIKVITDALGSTGATRLALSAGQMVPGTVDTATNSHSPTTTVFQADDITEATADHYNGRVIIFTSGVLVGQATSISDYVAAGGIGQFTVVAMTEAPANNDTFLII